MADAVRLRQICLIAERLEPVLDDLIAVFGLQVCYGKADLQAYGVPRIDPPPFQKAFFEGLGLASAILPVGDDFLEVVTPTRPDTAAARFLDRRGPGGYMVITEVADTSAFQGRVSKTGTRLAGVVDYPTYHELQIDPRDIGGAILSFSMQREGVPMDGGWFPAGPDWRRRRNPAHRGVQVAHLTSHAPDETAARWGRLIGRAPHRAPDGARIALDRGEIAFHKGENARLIQVDLAIDGFPEARSRAIARGLTVTRDTIQICGISFAGAGE